MEEMIKTLIVITLCLVVVFVLINVMRGGTTDQLEKFISVFSTEKRGDELTSSDYERMIIGYKRGDLQIEKFQVCKRYGDNLIEEYNEFQKKYSKGGKTPYC